MMYRMKISATMLVAAILLSPVAADEPRHSGHKTSGTTKQVDSAFERLKGLAGDWEIVNSKDESHKGKIASRFQVTASGSAVVETVFPGAEMEMVTVYHRDSDQLQLTHYCHLGNQPRMRTKSVDDNGDLVFHFIDSGALDPAKDMHMHAAHIRFIDANHLHAEWELYQDGKSGQVVKLDLVRQK